MMLTISRADARDRESGVEGALRELADAAEEDSGHGCVLGSI
jgi:hypothetical protein